MEAAVSSPATADRQPPTDVRVDVSAIERSFAELWRQENDDGEGLVTRAALWNVVAHTWTSEQQTFATETLAKASEAVPQRTIVVRADPDAKDDMTSWISANCHMLAGTRQVCSEEVVIVAEGERVHHVAPLVAALLLPDMPVAVWWLGELPGNRESYVTPLLDAADRLIVDSSHFNSADDLTLLARIAEETTTAPADLNWVRLEEWRAATAAIFDPPSMRERLHAIRGVRITIAGERSFGSAAEGFLYAAWLTAQLGCELELDLAWHGPKRGIESVELRFDDGTATILNRNRERGVLMTNAVSTDVDCITRLLSRGMHDLIVRQLKRPEIDRVYAKTLRVARRLAQDFR